VPAKASEGGELLLTLNLPLPDGTSRELKVKTVVPPGKKAGDVMELNIDPSMLHEGVLDDGNTSLFPEALPQSSTVHSLALQQLSNFPVDHGISDWSLAQPSLEEVFVNIATKFQKSPTASI
jgi:hypothetical protein